MPGFTPVPGEFEGGWGREGAGLRWWLLSPSPGGPEVTGLLFCGAAAPALSLALFYPWIPLVVLPWVRQEQQ